MEFLRVENNNNNQDVVVVKNENLVETKYICIKENNNENFTWLELTGLKHVEDSKSILLNDFYKTYLKNKE